MKRLKDYVEESLEREELSYKVSTWLQSRPQERELWDNACKSWKETRQTDDAAIRKFMDGTDVRGFVDFMNDEVSNDGVHPDDFETIKKIITNI